MLSHASAVAKLNLLLLVLVVQWLKREEGRVERGDEVVMMSAEITWRYLERETWGVMNDE